MFCRNRFAISSCQLQEVAMQMQRHFGWPRSHDVIQLKQKTTHQNCQACSQRKETCVETDASCISKFSAVKAVSSKRLNSDRHVETRSLTLYKIRNRKSAPANSGRAQKWCQCKWVYSFCKDSNKNQPAWQTIMNLRGQYEWTINVWISPLNKMAQMVMKNLTNHSNETKIYSLGLDLAQV